MTESSQSRADEAPRTGAGRSAPYVAAFAAIALFSVMDAVMKGAALDIGAYNALLWRNIGAIVVASALFIGLRERLPGVAALRIHALRGFIGGGMALLFFWSLTRLPLAEAIGLSFIAPVIALVLAALLLREQVGQPAIIASVLGLAGTGVILLGKFAGNYDPDAVLGVIALLISACLFAWNLILTRQQALIAKPAEIALFQSLFATLFLVPVAPWLAELPPIDVLPAIGGSALLSVGSLALLGWAYARAEAQALIPLEFTAFGWAALLGWLVFAEPVTLATLAGTALIVGGSYVAVRARPPSPIGTSAADAAHL